MPQTKDKGKNRASSALKSNDIKGLAEYIASDKCKNIILMLGAGVSTAAGIPDFRSPNTGLYANLARLNLPFPEAVFELGFFRGNPLPFYTLAKELYPGKFLPTLSHSFIRLLANHSLLHTAFTQNIDTLERRAGVPSSKIIEAHGSFATQRCILCKVPFDDDKMKKLVKACQVPRCQQDGCNGLVKPDIVFFGESLPEEFIQAVPTLAEADLLIVMGTSLTVHPFASLAQIPSESCPRVLINLERAGNIGSRPNDLLLLGKCDTVIKKLCAELGWAEELEDTWKETHRELQEAAEAEGEDEEELREANTSLDEDRLKAEVDKLTADIEKKLALQDVTSKLAKKQDTGKDPVLQDITSKLAQKQEVGKRETEEPSESSSIPKGEAPEPSQEEVRKPALKDEKSESLKGDSELQPQSSTADPRDQVGESAA